MHRQLDDSFLTSPHYIANVLLADLSEQQPLIQPVYFNTVTLPFLVNLVPSKQTPSK